MKVRRKETTPKTKIVITLTEKEAAFLARYLDEILAQHGLDSTREDVDKGRKVARDIYNCL